MCPVAAPRYAANRQPLTLYGVTVSVAVFVTPEYVALMVAVVCAVTFV